MEQRRRNPGVDPLIRLDLSVSEVEEGLPADETPRRPRAAAQIYRVCLTIPGRVEDHGEERLALVAGQVGAVAGAHHAVPEAVSGSLELHRNERLVLLRRIELPAFAQNSVHHRLTNKKRQDSLRISQ